MQNALDCTHAHPHEHHHSHHHHGHTVTITINGEPYSIHKGEHTAAAIKAAGRVPLADDLEQVIHGKLVPLPDNGCVKIEGHEVFVSHPKDSGSSAE